MSHKFLYNVYIFTLCLLLVACAEQPPITIPGVYLKPQPPKDLVPFTTDLREEFQLTADDLRRLQFYVSSDIHLESFLMSGVNVAVAGGRLKKQGDRTLEEILVHAYTPCGAMEVYDNRLSITFNPNYPERTLGFGDDGKHNGRYVLFAERWERTPDGEIGHLSYGGSVFKAINNSGAAYLLVGKDVLDAFKRRKSVEPGYVIPELRGE